MKKKSYSLLCVILLALSGQIALIHSKDTATKPWTPTAAEGWREVDFGDLRVKSGSALDFSNLVESGPAGKHGFAIVNAKGELVFENKPAEPLRLFVASDCMEYWPPETAEEIEEYVRQVRMAGYNCMRPHFLDSMLMIGTTVDGVINPVQLDRWDRLSAELKKQGIYLCMDIQAADDAFMAKPVQGEKSTANLKERLYWDPAARAHWARSMKFLLNHVNPYTGVALKDEPQVIFFALRNESGLHFLFANKKMPTELLSPFRLWLERRYSAIAKLNTAWAKEYKSFDEVPFPSEKGTVAPAADLERFIVDTELETYHWLKDQVDQEKVRSLVIDYNVGIQFGHNLSRSLMPLVDTHAYQDHPTDYISQGSKEKNVSSVPSGLESFVWLNESRQLDRPFVVTEWGFPYWNQWRYEGGMSIPAYAALQDWQFLSHHSEAIRLKATPELRPFWLACDPPGKLAERMAALLFARGDVDPSPHTVEIRLDPEGIFDRWGGGGYFPQSLRRLPLLVRTGIRVVDYPESVPGAKTTPDLVMRIHPKEREIVWTEDPDLTVEQTERTPSTVELVDHLRKRGLLAADNKTDPSKGVFQSDTGQLTVRLNDKTIFVDTPRSQGAALPEGSHAAKLADVTVENQGNSGAFFVSSLDAKPLKESRRMLILAVGDALNSGAKYTNPNREELMELGAAPVLVKPLKVTLEIQRSLNNKETAKLWGLSWNGERIREIPLEILPDRLKLSLNTADYPAPIFHFELIVKENK